METLPSTIESILQVLADKFGTTIEHLWAVMVRQAHVSAFSSALIIACVLVITVILKKHTWWLLENSEDGIGAYACWLILAIFWVAIIVGVIPEIITQFLNPEFWALKQIPSLFGGG